MRVEEKVSVEFNLSNPQDLNDYKAFKNMRNTFQAMLKFKTYLDEIGPLPGEPSDEISEIKEKYIKVLNEHGIEV